MRTCSKATVRGLPTGRKSLRLLHLLTFGTEACPSCRGKLLCRDSYAWCGPCRRKVRAKAATWLKGCKLSPEELLRLLSAWQCRATPGDCVRMLGLSYPTVRRWFARFRAALPEDRGKLSGEVDVDEAFFGRRRHGNQCLVLGMRERSGRLRLREIPDREEGTLELKLLEHVETATRLHTDAHGGYLHVSWHGYGHEVCNHSARDFSGTARIESEWSRMKRQIRKLYGRFHRPYLEGLLREWEAWANFPELFTGPEAYLRECLVPR